MDAQLRRYERDGDTRRFLINYARSIGATFAGNIKSRVESLWLWRATGEGENQYQKAVSVKRWDLRERRRIEYLKKLCKGRPHNVEVRCDYSRTYLQWDGEKHVEIDIRRYVDSRVKLKQSWFVLETANNGGVY